MKFSKHFILFVLLTGVVLLNYELVSMYFMLKRNISNIEDYLSLLLLTISIIVVIVSIVPLIQILRNEYKSISQSKGLLEDYTEKYNLPKLK